jgi:long-chain acyl-CoA synthetase
LEGKNQSFLLELFLLPFKNACGGRVRAVISGGAPILPDIYDFFKVAITPIVDQGYGLTEICTGLAVQEYPD